MPFNVAICAVFFGTYGILRQVGGAATAILVRFESGVRIILFVLREAVLIYFWSSILLFPFLRLLSRLVV